MKIQGPDGKTLEIEVQPGAPPPTDADIDALFATQARREAVVAPAISGAQGRNTDAANQELARIDPRAAAGGTVEVSPRTIASGAAMTAGIVAPMSGMAVRAGVGAIPGVLHGNLKEAATGAALDALGGPAVGKALRLVSALRSGAPIARTIRGLMSSAAPLAEAGASEAAPATVKALMTEATPAASEAAPVVTGGSGNLGALRKFVKSAVPDAKLGQKIHVLLDQAGNAVKVLTPGEASAVPEALKTWIKAGF